jgi:hypothetical protein
MKRTSIVIPVALIALALGSSACKKDASTSSGSPTLGVKILALNKNYSLPVVINGTKSASAVTASMTWDTAIMTVSRVKIEAEMNSLASRHDSIKIEYEWSGPQSINLFDSNITVGNFALQPGYYDEMELKVDGFKHDAGNKPVFYLHGVYTSETLAALPVMVIVNEDIMFKSEKDSINVTGADNDGFTSIIQLKLDHLLADIQLPALDNATLTNGAIIISAKSNTGLYMIIMRNLRRNHHSEHGHGHHWFGSMYTHMNGYMH